MRFLEFNEITLVFGPDCSCFPDSINEQFPFIHLSGLIHVFIFVSEPKDESLEGEGGPDSISTDSFTYPPSFTDLKSVAQYQPTVLLMKTIKEVFNWAIYPLTAFFQFYYNNLNLIFYVGLFDTFYLEDGRK